MSSDTRVVRINEKSRGCDCCFTFNDHFPRQWHAEDARMLARHAGFLF